MIKAMISENKGTKSQLNLQSALFLFTTEPSHNAVIEMVDS